MNNMIILRMMSVAVFCLAVAMALLFLPVSIAAASGVVYGWTWQPGSGGGLLVSYSGGSRFFPQLPSGMVPSSGGGAAIMDQALQDYASNSPYGSAVRALFVGRSLSAAAISELQADPGFDMSLIGGYSLTPEELTPQVVLGEPATYPVRPQASPSPLYQPPAYVPMPARVGASPSRPEPPLTTGASQPGAVPVRISQPAMGSQKKSPGVAVHSMKRAVSPKSKPTGRKELSHGGTFKAIASVARYLGMILAAVLLLAIGFICAKMLGRTFKCLGERRRNAMAINLEKQNGAGSGTRWEAGNRIMWEINEENL